LKFVPRMVVVEMAEAWAAAVEALVVVLEVLVVAN
jgi:hypothetical protein